ncbi:MAG: proton-conducting transporter membrane subunit [bacterium]
MMTQTITNQIGWQAALPVWVILVPVLTAFISIFVSRFSETARKLVVIVGSVLDFVLILLMTKPVLTGVEYDGKLYRGIETGMNWMESIGLSFRVDNISYLMVLLVGFVWLLAVIYGEGYFKKEGKAARYDFFSLITMAMNLGVMLAGDFLTLFIFFEGLVIFPYSMIAHRDDEKSVRGANFYLYVGVVTGLFLLCGMLMLNYYTGSLNIVSQGGKLGGISAHAKYIIAFLMIFGFGGKAALFGEHIWVPRMYPNTLSITACLSSGAMIKAGAYGIFRVVNLIYSGFDNNLWTQENIGYVMIMIGVVTMFLGVLNALISSDSQEMLGYHSVSQMGYIMMGIGCAAYMGKDGAMGLAGALYHIVNHSLFKASLFLCVGAVYFSTGEQDMYKLGGLRKKMPLSAVCLLIAVLGISGVPGFNGFASKTLLHHSILEAYEHSVHYFGKPDNLLRFAEIIFVLTAAGTFASNIKLFILVFLGKEKEISKDAKEVPLLMKISLVGFSAAIILIGLFPNWLLEHIIGPGLGSFGYDPSSHAYEHIYNIHRSDVHSILPILYDPLTKAFFTSPDVLHNLLPGATAIFLGGMYFILGLRFGWFHVHVTDKLTVEYYYGKIFDGFRYFCVKPCVIFAVWVREFISVLMVYIWVPGSHEGIFIKHPAPKMKGLERFSDADTKFHLVYDENMKKQPGAYPAYDELAGKGADGQRPGGMWEVFGRADKGYDSILGEAIQKQGGMWEVFGRADTNYDSMLGEAIQKQGGMWEVFGRADTNYDSMLGEAIQRQGGMWRIFGRTDMTYDTILDRVIAAIIGVEEIPISVVEEEEVLEKLPGEGLVQDYYKFCDANRSVDLNIIDGFVNYLADLTNELGGSLRKLQTGKVSSYAYSFVLGAVILLFIVLFI